LNNGSLSGPEDLLLESWAADIDDMTTTLAPRDQDVREARCHRLGLAVGFGAYKPGPLGLVSEPPSRTITTLAARSRPSTIPIVVDIILLGEGLHFACALLSKGRRNYIWHRLDGVEIVERASSYVVWDRILR
jgi:hypothetical protein